MSVRSTRRRLVATAATAAATVPTALAFGLSGTASAAAPADLPQQQVAAVAEAGTVYMSGTWSGYVAIPSDGGQEWSPLLQANFSCSGFVASSDGYIVTAGHCADVAEGKKALVDEFLGELVQSGDLSASDAQALIAGGAEDALPVEGKQAGSPPVLTSKIYPAIAIGGTGNFQGYDATVVDDRPLARATSRCSRSTRRRRCRCSRSPPPAAGRGHRRRGRLPRQRDRAGHRQRAADLRQGPGQRPAADRRPARSPRSGSR